MRAYFSCSPCNVRLDSSHSKARAEALYSTGNVTIENTADIAIIAIPIQHTIVLPEKAIRAIPARITHVAMLDANCTIGTSDERNTSGA